MIKKVEKLESNNEFKFEGARVNLCTRSIRSGEILWITFDVDTDLPFLLGKVLMKEWNLLIYRT